MPLGVTSRAMFLGLAAAEPRSPVERRLGADFRERGRAQSWHGSLYRQRLGSGVPVIKICALAEGITSGARYAVVIARESCKPFSGLSRAPRVRFGSIADFARRIGLVRSDPEAYILRRATSASMPEIAMPPGGQSPKRGVQKHQWG